ncbi:MAG: SAM-dependent methyltransferase [Nocardioidaceae bacterium]
MTTDWAAWHRGYDEPGSDLSRRLRSVQRSVDAFLDARPEGPVRVVSACSGDGRDLLEVLERRPDCDRVHVRLLEVDPALAGLARERARLLAHVDARPADAGISDSYEGAVPADLVMMCGVFGNVTDEDLHALVRALPQLCAEGATVIWTRGRFRSGDLTPQIRSWFADAGFEEVSFDVPEDAGYRVGVHRLVALPQPLERGRRLFTFTR